MCWEIERDMPPDELASWAAWFELKGEAQAKATKEAKSKSGKANRGRR